MGLVEKSVLLLGQSQVALEHNRRLYLLSRFMRDPKKAAELPKRNEPVLERADGREELFGPTFYKALYKRAKGNKRGAEIKREFASHYIKPKNKPFGNNRAGSSQQGYSKRPFPRGSTHNQNTQRGAYHGNQSRGRGQKSRGFHKPKSEYLYIFSSSTSGIK